MHAFEYLVGLVSILIGIALADLALSLHRLLRAEAPIRWHWHPLAAAALVVLLVLDFWWSLRQLERVDVTLTVGMFLPMLAALIVFVLLSAAALPDRTAGRAVDLKAFYDGTARYFWSMFALYVLLTTVHVMTALGAVHEWRPTALGSLPSNLLPNLIVVALAVSLTRIRRDWWNSAVLLVLMAALLSSHFNRPLA